MHCWTRVVTSRSMIWLVAEQNQTGRCLPCFGTDASVGQLVLNVSVLRHFGSLSRYCRRGDQTLMIQTWSVSPLWLSCRTFSDYFSPKSKGGSQCQILHVWVLMSRVCWAKRKPWFTHLLCWHRSLVKGNLLINKAICLYWVLKTKKPKTLTVLLPRILCSGFFLTEY